MLVASILDWAPTVSLFRNKPLALDLRAFATTHLYEHSHMKEQASALPTSRLTVGRYFANAVIAVADIPPAKQGAVDWGKLLSPHVQKVCRRALVPSYADG
jgi:hypothetical protein